MSMVSTVNPATGKTIQEYAYTSASDCDARLQAAHKAFLAWRQTDMAHRARCLEALSDAILKHKKAHAMLIASEMGKPIVQAEAELEKCALNCRFYAEKGPVWLADEVVDGPGKRNLISYQPLGVVLMIMPWNYPFWQVLRLLPAVLMAGNAVLLKHALNVLGCADALVALGREAGFPEGLFDQVVLPNEGMDALVEDDRIVGVALTGSPRAGQAVATAAARGLKPCLLELGGSDPYVVLDDADLAHAASVSVASRMNNTGQVCIAAKRILVTAKRYDAFYEALMAALKTYRMGDPLDSKTDLGPLARDDLRVQLHAQVLATVEAGAQCVLGGVMPSGPGYYYPPTVLTGVRPGMVAFDEELFGPVLVLIRAADEAEALALANQTPYGLSAVVFTQDEARGLDVARTQLDAGACFVNGKVSSDARLPFGGIKKSGYGRELGVYGARAFVNIKTVVLSG